MIGVPELQRPVIVSEKAVIVREIYDFRSNYSPQTSINSTWDTFIHYVIIEEDHCRIEADPAELGGKYMRNL